MDLSVHHQNTILFQAQYFTYSHTKLFVAVLHTLLPLWISLSITKIPSYFRHHIHIQPYKAHCSCAPHIAPTVDLSVHHQNTILFQAQYFTYSHTKLTVAVLHTLLPLWISLSITKIPSYFRHHIHIQPYKAHCSCAPHIAPTVDLTVHHQNTILFQAPYFTYSLTKLTVAVLHTLLPLWISLSITKIPSYFRHHISHTALQSSL